MKIDLSGQKALITGGTRGIGRAIAIELARHGADVAINYMRNRKAAAEAEELIEKETGKKPLVLKCNVADEDKIASMFEQLKEEWGSLAILISNPCFPPCFCLGKSVP